MNDKQQALQQLASYFGPDYIFGDTETTGFAKTSELVEIGLVDHEGNVLMDTTIRPQGPIPTAASDIHGLTADKLADSPTWDQLHQQFLDVVGDKTLVFYNSSFDVRLIKQTADLYGLGGVDFEVKMEDQSACAMKAYARYNGLRNKNGSYKSVKLLVAAEQEGVSMIDQAGGAHRAVYDALLVQRMCKVLAEGSATPDTAGQVTSF